MYLSLSTCTVVIVIIIPLDLLQETLHSTLVTYWSKNMAGWDQSNIAAITPNLLVELNLFQNNTQNEHK